MSNPKKNFPVQVNQLAVSTSLKAMKTCGKKYAMTSILVERTEYAWLLYY